MPSTRGWLLLCLFSKSVIFRYSSIISYAPAIVQEQQCTRVVFIDRCCGVQDNHSRASRAAQQILTPLQQFGLLLLLPHIIHILL